MRVAIATVKLQGVGIKTERGGSLIAYNKCNSA